MKTSRGYFFVERQTAAWLSQPTSPPGSTCWFAPNPVGALKDLEADPAAAVIMPGAEPLPPGGAPYRAGVERSCGPIHPYPAELALLYGTQASFDEVVAFYDRTLLGTGWAYQPDLFPARPSPATRASPTWAQWCKPGMTLSVVPVTMQASGTPAAWDGFPHDPALLGGRSYATVYGVGLRSTDPATPCPLPIPTAVPTWP
jgi:hypothetical protein